MSVLDAFRLDSKVAFVTGGARGIGKCSAQALCDAGATVILVDRDSAAAQETAKELSETGKAIALSCDVTQPTQVDDMVQTILRQYGRLDIAFCNAGICISEPAKDMSFENWKAVIDVNLTGVFLTAQAAGRVMIRQGGGCIITTASMSGHIVNIPQPQCAYNASKAGVIQLSKSLAVEWAEYHVRVNSISPGYIGTDLVLTNPSLKPLIAKWEELSPMKRIGTPEELQTLILYLASDASSFTTGSDFVVDGAFTAI
jgi:NAD(P)-dependent dehydrogenase (short-subunit alcohol dehydrogenase family)